MAEHGGGYKTSALEQLHSGQYPDTVCWMQPGRDVGPFGHPLNLSFVDHLPIQKKNRKCPSWSSGKKMV